MVAIAWREERRQVQEVIEPVLTEIIPVKQVQMEEYFGQMRQQGSWFWGLNLRQLLQVFIATLALDWAFYFLDIDDIGVSF